MMARNSDQLLQCLRGADALFARHGVIAAYLFGSHAEQAARADSDVDVAVLFARNASEQEEARRRLDVLQDLAALLKAETGVVSLNAAPLRLVGQVLKHGQLVFCADGRARAEFEARALRLYFELHIYDRAHDQALVRRIKEGRLGERFRPRKIESALAGARRVQEYIERHPASAER
jgi:predicted nucleotidyltransferase